MKHEYWYWKNFICLKDREKLVNHIENNYDFLEEENLYDKRLKKTNPVKCMEWHNIQKFDIVKYIVDCMIATNENNFGYNLYPFHNHTAFNLTSYNSDKREEYKWHIDASKNDIKDIKLTGLVNLSLEKYEGGEFEINNGEESIIKEFSEGGDMILIKSNLLHRVKPVTKGVRKTLAYFFEGPRFL